MTEDVRVVLIKLAERTYALRELANSSRERQERVSTRNSDHLFSSSASLLGIAQLKWNSKIWPSVICAPERYKEIASLLNEKRLEREQVYSVCD